MRTLLRMTGRLLVSLIGIYCVGLIVLALLWLSGVHGYLVAGSCECLRAVFICAALAACTAQLGWFLRGDYVRATALAVVAFFGLFGARFIPPAAQRHWRGALAVGDIQSPLRSRRGPAGRPYRGYPRTARRCGRPSGAIATGCGGDLARADPVTYPYQALAPSASLSGMGVLSRYPLRSATAAAPAHRAIGAGAGRQCGCHADQCQPDIAGAEAATPTGCALGEGAGRLSDR